MSNYWPSKNVVEGFSIEKLAAKYRQKLTRTILEDNNKRISTKQNEKIYSNFETLNIHWANRDFQEYKAS